MDTKILKCFQIVCEEKSLSRAAKRLYITPQGLSKNIRQLEQRRERLRIGCANGVLNLLPLSLILAFGVEHTGLRLEWREYPNRQVKEKLLSSEIEYGFVIGGWVEAGVECRKITGCRLCLMVYEGHPLFEEEQASMEQLSGESLLLMNESFRLYHDFTACCALRGIEPNIVAKTADGAGLYRLCSQKVGLAVAPEFFREEFQMRGMKLLPFAENLWWEIYGAHRRETAEYENIRLFVQYLKRHLPR